MNAFSPRRFVLGCSIICLLALAASAAPAVPLNTLSADEAREGWQLLWDGQTTKGWRSVRGTPFPARGWKIADGVLTVESSKGKPGSAGGDIVTERQYGSFELAFDFRITPGANSGVKYLVDPGPKGTGTSVGFEYQVLDDARHPDAKAGRGGNRTLGSLYDLLPASPAKKVNPVGEWNSGRIVVRGAHVEHWLNGAKIVEFDRSAAEFRAVVAASKFKSHPNYGEYKEGYILLQDHGNEVSYRNLKIRVLDTQR